MNKLLIIIMITILILTVSCANSYNSCTKDCKDLMDCKANGTWYKTTENELKCIEQTNYDCHYRCLSK